MTVASAGGKSPLYPRLLRLKNIYPVAWQRALLVEGVIAMGGLLALADLATAWTPVVLPVGVAVMVKFHDVLTGVLRPAKKEDGAAPAREDAVDEVQG